MLTVHELRMLGNRVRINHYRCVNNIGGATTVDVELPNGEVASGVALCNYEDYFNRKRGLRIALGRALKKIGLETK